MGFSANNKQSSQKLILAGLNSQPVSPSRLPVPTKDADFPSSKESFHPKISTATALPPGADVKVTSKGAQFKPRRIVLESGVVTTIGSTLTYHRQAFGNQVRLFDYNSAMARDMRWIASLLHSAGVQHTSVTSGRVGANFTQAQLERQLQTLGINTLAVARLSTGSSTLWHGKPAATKWQHHHAEQSMDLPLPSSAVALTA